MHPQEQRLHATIARLQERVNKHQKSLEQLQRRSDIQSALNDILQISLLPIGLEELLERILKLILDIPWLALEKKGLSVSDVRRRETP